MDGNYGVRVGEGQLMIPFIKKIKRGCSMARHAHTSILVTSTFGMFLVSDVKVFPLDPCRLQ